MRDVRNFLGKAWNLAGAVATLLVLLDALANPPRWLTVLLVAAGDYASIIYDALVLCLLIAFGLFCIRVGIQYAPQLSKLAKSRAEVSPTLKNRPLIVSLQQFKYREKVRAELFQLHSELYQITVPKLILFKSWNDTIDHSLKHERIAVKEQDKAIERFATALNHRNDNLHAPNFDESNDDCIARFVEIRQTGFFDVTLENPEAVRIQLSMEQLKQTELRFEVSSTGSGWFEIGVENGKLIDIGRWEYRSGEMEPPIAHENYFTINHPKPENLSMKIKATFELPRNKAVCLLRKGDDDHLTVDVWSGHYPFRSFPFFALRARTVGGWTYAKSPKLKNELTFTLDKI